MSSETKITYCRICEALCGMEVTVDGDRIVDVKPDKAHPVSKGFACVKGIGLGALHHDPDRLKYPLKRVDGRLERISWQQALQEIGTKLRSLRAAHGARALALYTGNPTFFNYKSFFFAEQFVDALGTPNLFASHSIDCNNKFDVSQRMYGVSTVHPIVDFSRVKFLMILGGNPAASQMSFIQLPNALQRLKQITRRGGRVIIVDPRRNETAQQVGEYLSIRPGTDAYFLLAMLQVVVAEKRFDRDHVQRFMRGFDAMCEALHAFTPEQVAETTGISSDAIRTYARDFSAAAGAALYMSTGVNMGPFGSVAYWALQCLNLITGNVDREGGLLQPKGPFDLLAFTAALGVGKSGRTTRDGRLHAVVDALPAGALADEIMQPGADKIRALIVSAGNPVHSVPGGNVAQALSALELLVSIDIYPNETSRYAHYILPATDMLERSDYPLTTSLNQETPVAQFTERVIQPAFERREEWEIFSELALLTRPWSKPGLCHVFGLANRILPKLARGKKLDPDRMLALLFRLLGDVSLSQLRKAPHGKLLAPSKAGTLLGKRVHTPDKLVDLAPSGVIADLARVRALQASLTKPDGTLVMIGRREKRSHNSWMHNHTGIQQPTGGNTLLMHPKDAELRGIASGDRARVSGNDQSFDLPVELSDQIRPGVVAVPHGWGHADSELTRAKALGGGNANLVMQGGRDFVEPVSGQAIMVGQEIEVELALVPNDPTGSELPSR